MKRTGLLFLLSYVVSSASAQDTIRTQDLTNANDTFVLSIGSSFVGIDPVATGANYNWDYTQLGRTGQRIDTIFSVAATNLAFSVYFSFLYPSDQARKGASAQLGTGLPGLSDVYNFYNNTNSVFTQTGFGATVNSIPLPIPYSPADVLYKFPLKFNDEDSIAYEYTVDLSSTIGIYFGAKKTRHNLVDGWGTLQTPFGTFSALRVKSIITERDSVHIDSLGFGLNLPVITTKEYKWLGAGFGLPILQINTNASNVITQILYQDSIHYTAVNEIENFSGDVAIFPNPATDFLSVRFTLNKKSNVSYTLLTAEGRTIFNKNEAVQSVGEKSFIFDLTSYHLASGNYFFTIKAGNSVITRPLYIGKN